MLIPSLQNENGPVDFKKIKNLGFRVPVWLKSPTRTRTDNSKKISIQVPELKEFNVSVRVPKNLVRVSGFRLGFLVSDCFECP